MVNMHDIENHDYVYAVLLTSDFIAISDISYIHINMYYMYSICLSVFMHNVAVINTA